MGKAPALGALVVTDTLTLFSSKPGPARHAYNCFVADGLDRPLPQTKQQLYLGDDAFAVCMAQKAIRPSSEVPRRQRAVKTLAQYARDSESRNAAIKAAYASGAYSLKAIGAYFGLHYATVSRIARQ